MKTNTKLKLFVFTILTFSLSLTHLKAQLLQPPVASIQVSAYSGGAPLVVSFDGSASQNANSFFWDFGDGSGSSSVQVSHTFQKPGAYFVKLTVSNLVGSDTRTAIITVHNPFMPFSDHQGLRTYLDRAVTLTDLPVMRNNMVEYNKAIQFLVETNTRFVGRSEVRWGGPNTTPSWFIPSITSTVNDVEAAYNAAGLFPPILQACIFEHLEKPAVEANIAPKEILNLFYGGGITQDRNFDFELMLYDDDWRQKPGFELDVPDISKPETQAFFYFLATMYIDAGYKSLHMGQVRLMVDNDPGHVIYWNLLSKIRGYAYDQGTYILFDAHVDVAASDSYDPFVSEAVKDRAEDLMQMHNLSKPLDLVTEEGIYVNNEFEESHNSFSQLQLLFDLHSCPTWARETEQINGNCEAEIVEGHHFAIFNKSPGGVSPNLGTVSELPYIVELDNGASTGSGCEVENVIYEIWGTDEKGWYLNQSVCYRAEFVRYAYPRVKEFDSHGSWQPMAYRGCLPISDFSCTAWNNPAIKEAILDVWDPPYISGPDDVCNSGSTYTIDQFAAGRTASWSVSPSTIFSGSTSGSGTTATLYAGGSGPATITFTLHGSNGCQDYVATKDIWVGLPSSLGSITGPSTIDPEAIGIWSVNNPGNTSNFNWTLPFCTFGNICWSTYSSGDGYSSIAALAGENSGYVQVNNSNSCGTGPTSLKYVTVNEGGGGIFQRNGDSEINLHVYPNPASNSIIIETSNHISLKNIQISDLSGKVLLRKQFNGERYKMDISSLPAGSYMLTVSANGLREHQVFLKQ